MIVDEKYLLDQQKEEIEFLAKDRDRYRELFNQAVKNRDEFAACCDTYIKQRQTASINYRNLENMNNLLKKQVAELTEQRDVFKRLFENANESHITCDEIINTMNSFYREQAEHLAGLKIEQATKDAVKKFADLVEFHSVATMEDNIEYFTISALGLKEILRENFDVEVK